jgi:hypothetical protein
MLKTASLPLKARRHPLLSIDGAGLCTLVNIGSIFYTSVQGTYFYQVIFGTKFEIFREPKHSKVSLSILSTINSTEINALWGTGNVKIPSEIKPLILQNISRNILLLP